jgi:hypothetical protein
MPCLKISLIIRIKYIKQLLRNYKFTPHFSFREIFISELSPRG